MDNSFHQEESDTQQPGGFLASVRAVVFLTPETIPQGPAVARLKTVLAESARE